MGIRLGMHLEAKGRFDSRKDKTAEPFGANSFTGTTISSSGSIRSGAGRNNKVISYDK